MRTMVNVSKSRIRSARRKGLSGLEGLLAVVGIEVTMEGIRTGTGTERWTERVRSLAAVTLKLRAPNDADKVSREKISIG